MTSRPARGALPALLLVPLLGTSVAGCGDDPTASRGATPGTPLPAPTTTPGQEWTTVPEVPFGWSVDRAVRRLARAGLVGDPPEVAWPHYAVGTDPAAGTRVRVGSTVGIEIGDG